MRAVLEGLTHLGPPCVEVLSVAGFYALLALIPLEEEVYSEGEEAPLFASRPLSFNLRTKSDINPAEYVVRVCHMGVRDGCVQGGYTYGCTQGGHIQGGIPTHIHQVASQLPYTPG